MSTATQDESSVELNQFLAKSGLCQDDVPGWRYVNRFQIKRVLGLEADKTTRYNGIQIPYNTISDSGAVEPLQVNGVEFCRVRQIPEAGQVEPTAKYLSPAGTGAQLYIPAKMAGFLSGSEDFDNLPLVITEGEKKAEALVKAGIPAVGLGGVTMWSVREDPDDRMSNRVFLPALAETIQRAIQHHAALQIVVLFDSDGRPIAEHADGFKPTSAAAKEFVQNKDVFFEGRKCAKFIRQNLGANVASDFVPFADDQHSKMGVDDWILRDGAQAVQQAIAEIAAKKSRSAGRTVEPVAAPQSEGYVPLGSVHDGVVVWGKPQCGLFTLRDKDLSSSATIQRVCGPTFAQRWMSVNEKTGKETFDALLAQREIITACLAAGAWRESRERAGGVWREGDALYINSDKGLFEATLDGLKPLDDAARISAKHVYVAAADYAIEPAMHALAGHEIVARLVNHFARWGYKSHAEAGGHNANLGLLVGWLALQSYLGALSHRPSLLVTGESGSGKTFLVRHASEVLGGTVIRVDDSSQTSLAGIRQSIGKSAITTLLDEVEPSSQNQRTAEARAAMLAGILAAARAAYSSDDAGNSKVRSFGALKGSAGGEARNYAMRTAFLLSGIGVPEFEQADANRFIIIELDKATRGQQEPDDSDLAEIGEAMRHRMWRLWSEFKQVRDHLMQHWRTVAPDAEARLITTWGGPIAALAVLQYETNAIRPEELSQALEMLSAVATAQRAASVADQSESDAEKALAALLRAKVVAEQTTQVGTDEDAPARSAGTVQTTVAELFEAAEKPAPKVNDNWAQIALKRIGLKRIDAAGQPPALFVVPAALKQSGVMRGTAWEHNMLHSVLLRYPGARKSAPGHREFMIGKMRATGIYVPIVPESAEPAR